MVNRFALKIILLAVIPALAIFSCSVILLNNLKSSISDYLSEQTEVSLEQIYQSHLKARSLELAATINQKLASYKNETKLLANRAQLAIDQQQPNRVKVDLVYDSENQWAYSPKNTHNTVFALWSYLLEPNGQLKPETQAVLDIYQGLDPFLASIRQSGVEKSWSYIVGPKQAPIVYATPWENIPAMFSTLYPEHKNYNWWDYFFPGMTDSWQHWQEEGRMPDDQITLTSIYEDAAGKGELITFFHPLWQQQQNFGAVAIDVNVDQLLGIVKSESIEEHGFATIISSRGELIGPNVAQAQMLGLSDNSDTSAKGVRLKQYNLLNSRYAEVAKLSLSGKESFFELTLAGEKRYVSAAMIATVNVWHEDGIRPVNYYAAFVLGKDEVIAIKEQLAARLSKNLDEKVLQAAYGSVLTTIIALIMAIYFALRHRYRIAEITAAASRISAREFDTQITVTGQDEISKLASHINEMGKELSQYDAMQKAANATLSLQVAERTQELERARIEAEQANNAKSLFLASMSHEIRTPLTTVIGYAEGMLNGDINSHEHQKATRTIVQSGQHLLQLVNDILDLSKIEAGQLPLENRRFNLVAMLSEVFDYAKNRGLATKNQFHHMVNYPLTTMVLSDEVRVKQILLNLLSNAFKFTKDGDVFLKVKQKGNNLCFSVVDTGIGIEEDKLDAIFKPFEQLSHSTTRLYGGTGLGLSISYQLVNLMGGKIEVTSKPNVGSEFSFCLPIGEAEQKLVHSDTEFNQMVGQIRLQQRMLPHDLKGKVLLAEDNPDNRVFIEKILTRMGLDVISAVDGEQAVELALTNDFDLILMDIQMPKLRGDEALSLLQNAGNEAPVVALTANVLSHEVQNYLAQGFTNCLAKPIERAEFIRVISTILQMSTSSVPDNLIDDDEFKQLKDRFFARLPAELNELENALSQGELVIVKRLCHRMKGAAAIFKELELADLCDQIERMLSSDTLETCKPVTDKLQALMKTLISTAGVSTKG